MTTHIVLLRGINVGKHNRIAMSALSTMLTDLGYSEVRTLLNSGNVVVTTTTTEPSAVAQEIQDGIQQAFGLSIKTIVRSRTQIERIIARNPMLAEAEQAPKFFHVGFCDPAPTREIVESINRQEITPDKIALDEDTLYFWFASGLRESALAKALTKYKLDATTTLRNWNTVRKLLKLAQS